MENATLCLLCDLQSDLVRKAEFVFKGETDVLTNELPFAGAIETRVMALAILVFGVIGTVRHIIPSLIELNTTVIDIGDITLYRLARVNLAFFATILLSLTVFSLSVICPEILYGYIGAEDWVYACANVVFAEMIPVSYINHVTRIFQLQFLPDGGERIKNWRGEIHSYFDSKYEPLLLAFRLEHGFKRLLEAHYTQEEILPSVNGLRMHELYPNIQLVNDTSWMEDIIQNALTQTRHELLQKGVYSDEEMNGQRLDIKLVVIEHLLLYLAKGAVLDNNSFELTVEGNSSLGGRLSNRSNFCFLHFFLSRLCPIVQAKEFTLEKMQALKELLCKRTDQEFLGQALVVVEPDVKKAYEILTSSSLAVQALLTAHFPRVAWRSLFIGW